MCSNFGKAQPKARHSYLKFSLSRKPPKKDSINFDQFLGGEEFIPGIVSDNSEQVHSDFSKLKKQMTNLGLNGKLEDFKRNFQVFMFGGCDAVGAFYDNHLRKLKFTSSSGKLLFTKVPVKGQYRPEARIGHCLEFYLPAQMLVLSGGRTKSGRFLSDLDYFDLGTSTWQSIEINSTELSHKRAHHCMDILNEQIYIFGGINEEGYLSGTLFEFRLENPKYPLRPKLLV